MLDKGKSSVQDTKSDTKPNKRVHYRIEQARSRIETAYVFRLCLPISNWKFHRAF